jgi:hypothetical protein
MITSLGKNGNQAVKRDFVGAASILILGGLSFWVPDIAIIRHVTWRESWPDVTLACPVALLLFYLVAMLYKKGKAGPSASMFALFGIWLLAPWLMRLAADWASGKQAFQGMELADYLYLVFLSFFPPLTFWHSAMQGSGYALMLATIIMPVCHCLFETGRWIVPWRRSAKVQGKTGPSV